MRGGWIAAVLLLVAGCEGSIEPPRNVDPPVQKNAAPRVDVGADRAAAVGAPVALDARVDDDGQPNRVLTSMWRADGAATFGDATSTKTTVTFATPGSFTLTLSVSDGELETSDALVVTVTETTTNAAPVVSAGPDATGPVGMGVTLVGAANDDGVPGPLRLSWSVASGPGTATFAPTDAATTTATFDTPGIYVVRLDADDGALTASDTAQITVTPPDANDAPVVDAGGSAQITWPSSVTLTGTVTDDGRPSGTLVTTWSVVSGPGNVVFGDATDPATTASFETPGAYVLRLEASDGALLASDEVTVQVDPEPVENAAPMVNAGPSGNVVRPAALTLQGTATDDGLPSGTLTVAWSTVRGPGIATFTQPSAVTTDVTFSAAGTYVLRLTADDTALSASSDVTITVSNAPPANLPPSVSAGPSQTLRLPNPATLAGVATDDGRPSGTLTTMWYVVSAPGTVTFTNPSQLNTDVSFSLDGAYELRLDASDGALTASSNVMITVLPRINQAPTVNAGASQTITLGSTASLNGSATDDGLPAPATLTTTWSMQSGPGTVTFGDAASVVTTASFSIDGVYVLRLTASDGARVSFSNVTITVNPVPNQAPTVNAGVDQTITLPANAMLSGTASDDGIPAALVTTWSVVSGPGTVTVGDPNALSTTASFSIDGTYVLRLTADDSALNTTDDVTVTVNPAPPVNQAPTANAGADQTITLPANVALSGTASDDGIPAALVTTWSVVSGPGTVVFGDANALSTTASFSIDGTYVLRLTADDSALNTTDDVTVTVDPAAPAANTILMFVAYNDVWWPEYKVVYEALRAAGYTVEVRSSGNGFARSDYSSDVNATPSAQGLDPTYPNPISYTQFTQLYQTNFGQAWNASWNARANIPLAGRIQDVPNMNAYVALVMPGGRGQVAYRYDGSYAALDPINQPGVHVASAAEVQAAALAINTLVGQALSAGKIVAAECHGSPLIPFARVPGSTGGFGGLGQSVLAGRYATGYPFSDGDTPARYVDLNVTLVSPERVIVDGPRAPDFSGNGRDRIVTSTDWYPETAAYFARTLLNMLETYPSETGRRRARSVLVFGGDEPTNYAPQAPARYTDLVTLLNDPNDDLAITAVGTNNPADMTLTNLQQYDALVYFRHDTITQARQNAIQQYADGGGGVVGLHHAIFDHLNQKTTLVQMFGGALPANAQLNNELGVVYTGESNRMINVNYGHFVSTYGVHLLAGQPATTIHYGTSLGIPNENRDNDSGRGYFSFTIPANDELYLGAVFNAGTVFGSGTNQVQRLFSNDRFMSGSANPNNGQYDTAGWVRRYDPSVDGSVGRVVYMQPGETNARTLAHPSFVQVIKNGVIWAAP